MKVIVIKISKFVQEIEFVSTIRNVSIEQIESLKNTINTSNRKDKDKLLSKLDEIIITSFM